MQIAKYGRWIVFGVVAIGLIALLIFLGANKKLRDQIQALLAEKLLNNKVRDLQDQASKVQAQADAGKIKADEALAAAKSVEEDIKKHKLLLQQQYEAQGLSADEISNRFNNLRL